MISENQMLIKEELLISIVIPTLNRSLAIQKLINSFTNINWNETEIIIVDDSIESFENDLNKIKDRNINYIHRGKKLGVSSARNIGAKIAKGKYIIFLDDDDDITESWFSDFSNEIVKDYDLVFCDMKRIDKNIPNGLVVKPTDKKFGAMSNAIVIPGAFMVKKSIFNKVGGYDERLLYAENTELFFRINKLNPSRFFIDKVNFIYYPSEDGGSKNLMNMIDSNKIILEKHDDWLSDKMKYTYNQIIAVNYTRFGDQKNAAHHFMKAIKYEPFKFGTYIRFLISKSSFLRSFFYKLNFRK
jgi:glycosyltransferase involved in cell wall biosynthesis